NRLASAPKLHGLKKGDRVACLLPNIPAMLEAHFAIPLAGGIIVPINYRLSSQEIQYILEHWGASFRLVDTEFYPLVSDLDDTLPELKQIIHISDDPAYPTPDGTAYEDFLQEGSPDSIPWVVADEYEDIALNYTSGTTGKPKGVTYCHRGAYINAVGEIVETEMTPDSKLLWTLPMFHCNGWCFTWGVAFIGATHVCHRKFEPGAAWRAIEAEGVTHFNGAPVVLIAMVNHPDAPERFAHPVTICTAGAPPSPSIIQTVTEMGAHILHLYGLTETYGPYTVCTWQPDWHKLSFEAQGKLLARQGVGYAVGGPTRVVDEHMKDVPANGEILGEVVMQGNMVMKGYWKDPETTATAFRGGWFHSGDVAVMHPDGYIELRDRSKDVIISGGENISSIEVEQVIYRHPAVLECAVIGAPHEKWGETPKAYVTLKKGQELTQDELIAFCRENIAHFKAPTSIEFGPLPKTSTGKIQKFKLRDEDWAGREKRIQG
ncbi:MAG: AMP-binding protein, partial [Candidatus Hydrogenedentes bacterium]|nr:AMP-binding protein [Candidatus Hydrogenedentota bacterium]